MAASVEMYEGQARLYDTYNELRSRLAFQEFETLQRFSWLAERSRLSPNWIPIQPCRWWHQDYSPHEVQSRLQFSNPSSKSGVLVVGQEHSCGSPNWIPIQPRRWRHQDYSPHEVQSRLQFPNPSPKSRYIYREREIERDSFYNVVVIVKKLIVVWRELGLVFENWVKI